MNQERLLKIIQDMSESVGNIQECMDVIQNKEEDATTKFVVFGLKQIFVDFFITVEDFTSIMLKELKQFKIGMDMKHGLEVLNKHTVLTQQEFDFLNRARLMRNRIAHRYKEPSREELLDFIYKYESNFNEILNIAKRYMN